MTRPFAAVSERAAAAIARLEAAPAFLDGARRSIASGIPDEWRARALRECDGIDRLLQQGLTGWIAVESIDATTAERLTAAGNLALAAVQRYRRWLEREAPAAPADRYAIGPDLFDVLLARGHWCDRPRRELAADASAALEEALARVDERARRTAPGGWPEVQERLADAHPALDEYLSAYQQTWDACRRHAEAHDLVTWPDSPIRYVPIPRHTRDAAPFLYYLHYRSPAPFDQLPLHDYVVTPIEPDMDRDEQRRRLRATNASVIKLNHVVHHGAIGHHVQNASAYAGRS